MPPRREEVEGNYRDEDGKYSKSKHLTAVKKRNEKSLGPDGFSASTHPLMIMVIG